MKTNLNRRAFAGLLAWGAVSQIATWKSSEAEEAPLAIKGYDPVAYFTDGKPVERAHRNSKRIGTTIDIGL